MAEAVFKFRTRHTHSSHAFFFPSFGRLFDKLHCDASIKSVADATSSNTFSQLHALLPGTLCAICQQLATVINRRIKLYGKNEEGNEFSTCFYSASFFPSSFFRFYDVRDEIDRHSQACSLALFLFMIFFFQNEMLENIRCESIACSFYCSQCRVHGNWTIWRFTCRGCDGQRTHLG